MRLNVSTDYAIRLVLYLAKTTKTVSSSKLSAALGISPRYLLQIGAKLRDSGLVSAAYGPTGGFSLSRPAGEISLYDIILLMEEKIKAKQHADSDSESNTTDFSILETAYDYVDGVLGDILKSITIESLISQSIDQWYLAPCLMHREKEGREQL